jgi:Recombination endonuclease VII
MGRKRLFNDKEKWCNKCSKWLPLDAFGENKRTASGRQDYCKTCHNAYTGSFWAKVAAYEQLLAQKWRMTPGDYLERWRLQDKKCIICGAALTLYHRDTHVHVFGYQKRLLCTTCNKGMECFRDDPSLLVKALEQIDRAAKETSDSKDRNKGENADAEKGTKENLEHSKE